MLPATDRELVQLVLKGNREAFRPLVQQYYSRVLSLIRGMRGDLPAEDLAQEAFLRAFEKLSTFDATKPFRPWILRIAFHLALKEIRDKKRSHVSLFPGDLEADLLPAPPTTASQDERLILDDCIARLPLGWRITFLLRHSMGLSLEEIEDVLDEPAGTVKTHIHRACLKLRELLVGKAHAGRTDEDRTDKEPAHET